MFAQARVEGAASCECEVATSQTGIAWQIVRQTTISLSHQLTAILANSGFSAGQVSVQCPRHSSGRNPARDHLHCLGMARAADFRVDQPFLFPARVASSGRVAGKSWEREIVA